MRIINLPAARAEAGFAERAANHFANNPDNYTFAERDPEPGQLLAIRWNSSTVLIVLLDESHQPSLYPIDQFHLKDFPPLQPA